MISKTGIVSMLAVVVVMLSTCTPALAALADGGPGLADMQTWQTPQLAVYLPTAAQRFDQAQKLAINAQARLENIEASMLESNGYSRNDLYAINDNADMRAQVEPFRLIVAKANAELAELTKIKSLCEWSNSLFNYYQSGYNLNLAPVWPYPSCPVSSNADVQMIGGGGGQ